MLDWAELRPKYSNVRFWHLADMKANSQNVRSWR
jgi:hypothetical protein